MYNRVEFVAADGSSGDCLLEVRIAGVIVGRICRQPFAKTYRYYRITRNEERPFYEEMDLEDLLKRVSRSP